MTPLWSDQLFDWKRQHHQVSYFVAGPIRCSMSSSKVSRSNGFSSTSYPCRRSMVSRSRSAV